MPSPFERRDRHVGAEAPLPGLTELGNDLGLGGKVDLVDDHDDGQPTFAEALRDEPITGTDLLGGVEHEERSIVLGERPVDELVESLAEGGARTMETGRVDEHELCGRILDREHAADGVAGGLGARRGDRHLLAHQRVHQRRLADVGPPNDGDESRLHVIAAFRDGSERCDAPAPDRPRRRAGRW